MAHMSLLDPQGELPVDENTWVVGLLRKPKGQNPEHAFIVVEGCLPGGNVYLMRYDLFLDDDNPGKYMIHISEPKQTSLPQVARVLLEDIFKNDEVTGKCWSIAKNKAKELHDIFLKEKATPGYYNLLGNRALLPKTAGVTHATSPNAAETISHGLATSVEAFSGHGAATLAEEALKPSGHNCFTGMRDALHLLKIPEIQQDLPKKAEELIASMTSRHVNATVEMGTGQKCSIM